MCNVTASFQSIAPFSAHLSLNKWTPSLPGSSARTTAAGVFASAAMCVLMWNRSTDVFFHRFYLQLQCVQDLLRKYTDWQFLPLQPPGEKGGISPPCFHITSFSALIDARWGIKDISSPRVKRSTSFSQTAQREDQQSPDVTRGAFWESFPDLVDLCWITGYVTASR